MFALHPAEPAQALRSQIRASIGDVWGENNVPESEQWSPHVSFAYSNAAGPARPYIEALSKATATQAELQVSTVDLIVLNRDNRMYEWETYASVPIGAQ
jgi:hypothetical protein